MITDANCFTPEAGGGISRVTVCRARSSVMGNPVSKNHPFQPCPKSQIPLLYMSITLADEHESASALPLKPFTVMINVGLGMEVCDRLNTQSESDEAAAAAAASSPTWWAFCLPGFLPLLWHSFEEWPFLWHLLQLRPDAGHSFLPPRWGEWPLPLHFRHS